ncbi:MAG TPA: hypothetical protein VKD72_35455, partial [Gemmataceae bacterium]|nr:hypothetical protein [Gemmataceae bacterium]
TNLEQISDWLTKIIVGVGLVQLTSLPEKSLELGSFLATAFGRTTVPSAIILVILYYFGIFAFLLGYLWTRISLTTEFSRTEATAREQPEYVEGIMHALLYQLHFLKGH